MAQSDETHTTIEDAAALRKLRDEQRLFGNPADRVTNGELHRAADPKTTAREHVLKTLEPYWMAIACGAKTFEVRRDDRGFQKGDTLILRCTEPKTGHWVMEGSGLTAKPKELRMLVSYVLTGGQFGVEPGYVVMGLQNVRA